MLKTDELSIYPNPANTFLTISLPKDNDYEFFRVLDLFGKEHKYLKIDLPILNLDVSNFPSGTYILNFVSKQGVINRKFTVVQ